MIQFSIIFLVLFIVVNVCCIGHDIKRIADALEDFVYGDEADAEESEVTK